MRFDTPPSRLAIAGLLALGIGSSVLAAAYGLHDQTNAREARLALRAGSPCPAAVRRGDTSPRDTKPMSLDLDKARTARAAGWQCGDSAARP